MKVVNVRKFATCILAGQCITISHAGQYASERIFVPVGESEERSLEEDGAPGMVFGQNGSY
jgi:hypothetical protein